MGNDPMTDSASSMDNKFGTITEGPNTVSQQQPHGEDNLKHKSTGGDRPSLPTPPGESFNDKDYRNPDNRNNSDYGPTTVFPEMTSALGNQDIRQNELKGIEKTPEEKHQEEMEAYESKYNNGFIKDHKFEGTKELDLQDRIQNGINAKKEYTVPSSQTQGNALHSIDVISDMSKENADLKAQNDEKDRKLAELEERIAALEQSRKPYEQDSSLAAALDPNKPKTPDQLEVDNTYATINKDLNQKALNEIDEIKAKLETTPVVVPPQETTPEETEPTTPEQERQLRNWKTAALIAGVVGGGAAAILGGTAVGIPVAAASGVIALGSRVTNFFVGRSLSNIETQLLNSEIDAESKAKLEKRSTNLKRVQNIVAHVGKFFTGAAIGAGIGNFISMQFMGGHGLIWNKPEIPSGITGGAEANIGNTSTGGANPEISSVSPETYSGNSFIHDGHVDLPGSAWDGNMAGSAAQDTLAGGATNAANYSGGPSEMAANILGEQLKTNNITDALLQNLTTYDKHRLLTEYWTAIRSGNTSPELIATLRSIGTEGANKLLAALGH